MDELNMSIEPLGGSMMQDAFLGLAHSLAGKEETYQQFYDDTGVNLTELLEGEDKEVVDKYFDWVAMRYWGVQCHAMEEENVHEVYMLIQSVELEGSVFIKSSEDEVAKFVGQSLVIFKDGKIVAVVMVKDGYIDTVVSSVRGMATHLISSLPEGGYAVNISQDNDSSLKLFGKFGFTHVKDETVCGHVRGLYEGQIKS